MLARKILSQTCWLVEGHPQSTPKYRSAMCTYSTDIHPIFTSVFIKKFVSSVPYMERMKHDEKDVSMVLLLETHRKGCC